MLGGLRRGIGLDGTPQPVWSLLSTHDKDKAEDDEVGPGREYDIDDVEIRRPEARGWVRGH